MASVTEVIVLGAGVGSHYRRKDVDAWLHEHGGHPPLFDDNDISRYAGGTKGISVLHAAGFNYLDRPAFVEMFKSLPWEGCVTLLIKYEHDDLWDIHVINR